MRTQEDATILHHDRFAGDYRLLVLEAPRIAAASAPGQFVHLRVPTLEEIALRRPFSIYRARGRELSIMYKDVGRGTHALAPLPVGTQVSLLGPLGNGFPCDHDTTRPVCVAGGYGVAPLSFLAERLPRKGVLFVGGRTVKDILCTEDFEALGWELVVTTEDGSQGTPGRVTDALDAWLSARDEAADLPEFYACGPEGMLRAVGERALAGDWQAWLSLDNRMGCGVGACLACVQKVREADGRVSWSRACSEGPVFDAKVLVWDERQ